MDRETAPAWMSWVWEWQEDTLMILARDPEDEDGGHIVMEFKSAPDDEIVNMFMDSREVLMNIEELLLRKITEKQHKVTNVKLIMREGFQALNGMLAEKLRAYVGRKLTRKRAGDLKEEILEGLDPLITVHAETTGEEE